MNSTPISKDSNIRFVISTNLNKLMDERNLSRRNVCNDLNIKYTTFCDWTNGNVTPKIENLELLADYFCIDITDFFIERQVNNEDEKAARLKRYLTSAKELPMNTIKNLSDEKVHELLKAGFRFEHKSLEQYIAESEYESKATPTVDWGKPMGDELW